MRVFANGKSSMNAAMKKRTGRFRRTSRCAVFAVQFSQGAYSVTAFRCASASPLRMRPANAGGSLQMRESGPGILQKTNNPNPSPVKKIWFGLHWFGAVTGT